MRVFTHARIFNDFLLHPRSLAVVRSRLKSWKSGPKEQPDLDDSKLKRRAFDRSLTLAWARWLVAATGRCWPARPLCGRDAEKTRPEHTHSKCATSGQPGPHALSAMFTFYEQTLDTDETSRVSLTFIEQ